MLQRQKSVWTTSTSTEFEIWNSVTFEAKSSLVFNQSRSNLAPLRILRRKSKLFWQKKQQQQQQQPGRVYSYHSQTS